MNPTASRIVVVLRRLLDAVPDAWRHDRLFRWASIGAAICASTLLARTLDGEAGRSGPPPTSPAPPPPKSALGPGAVPSPSPEVPRIAPGRTLDSVTIAPSPHDAFGTIQRQERP